VLKIIIAPGAFKHSLSATAAAQAIAAGLSRSNIEASLIQLPIADGGNGTLDAYLAQGGQHITQTVQDPLGRDIEAAFGLLPDGKTAVIEMALASGIELISHTEHDAMSASTYGTGQLMQAALDAGARRFIIGMGGSATVDGGSGCLRALGVRLLDASGQSIPPGGGGLSELARIDTSDLDKRWRDTEIIIASDVENPTLGEQGAAAVFGPQKGATPEQVPILESNLKHFFSLVYEQIGIDVRDLAGGGAAGALSAGLIAFLGGRIQPGIQLILEQNDFLAHLKDADLVITGEGQMDEQTIQGKGPFGVAQLANEHGVPTVALVGGLAVDDRILHDAGLQAVLPILTQPMTLDAAIADAANLVESAALRLGYLLQIQKRYPI